MNTRADALKRPYRPTRLGPEVVTPLSGPAHTFGPSGVAKVRWRKPLPAIIADAIANSRGLSARLQRGMYMPDEGGKSFAEALERAIIRSQSSVPLLNGPAPELPAEELKKPMARYRRF